MAVTQKPHRERRAFGRLVTRQHGWICIPGRPRQSCLVSDISVAGALLELPREMYLPFNFVLVIDAAGFSSPCEIRHHRGIRVGVQFIEAMARPEAGGKPASADDVTNWRGASSGSPVRAALRNPRN